MRAILWYVPFNSKEDGAAKPEDLQLAVPVATPARKRSDPPASAECLGEGSEPKKLKAEDTPSPDAPVVPTAPRQPTDGPSRKGPRIPIGMTQRQACFAVPIEFIQCDGIAFVFLNVDLMSGCFAMII